jgi:hypothetical protein
MVYSRSWSFYSRSEGGFISLLNLRMGSSTASTFSSDSESSLTFEGEYSEWLTYITSS